MPNTQDEETSEANWRIDNALTDIGIVRSFNRLFDACPGVDAAALIEAVFKGWDQYDVEEKMLLILNCVIPERSLLDKDAPVVEPEPTAPKVDAVGPSPAADPPPAGSLEFWPALADDWGLPASDDGGRYVIRIDEGGTATGKWIATVIPNPAFDTFSRQRIAWLCGRAPELWQSLRDAARALDSLTGEAPPSDGAEEKYVRVLQLLAEVADFMPYGRDGSFSPADAAHRAVNDEAMYRLPDGQGTETTTAYVPKPEAVDTSRAAVRVGTRVIQLRQCEAQDEGLVVTVLPECVIVDLDHPSPTKPGRVALRYDEFGVVPLDPTGKGGAA